MKCLTQINEKSPGNHRKGKPIEVGLNDKMKDSEKS